MTSYSGAALELMPVASLLPEWFFDGAEVAVVFLRVSANNPAMMAENVNAAAAVMAYSPAMRTLAEQGGALAVLGPDLQGRELRQRLGIVGVMRKHAHAHAENPGLAMGHLWAHQASRELVLFIHDTIASRNVTFPGNLLSGNAATELLVQLLLSTPVTSLHLADRSRSVRDTYNGSRVNEAASVGRVALYVGGNRKDTSSNAGRLVADVESSLSQAERDAIVKRTTRARLALLTQGQEAIWPYATGLIPPGYVVGAVRRTQLSPGGKRQRVALIAPDFDYAPAWTAVFLAIAHGKSWPEVGDLLAQHRVPCRGVRTDENASTYDLKSRTLRASAARAIGSHAELLASRSYKRYVPVGLRFGPGETTFEGHPLVFDKLTDADGNPVAAVAVEVALPEHGVDLTPQQWAAVQARFSGARAIRARATGLGQRFMLSTIARWTEDGFDYNMTTESAYIRLRRRPHSVDASGNERGWLVSEGEVIYSVRCSDADAALGRGIANAAMHVLGQDASLELRGSPLTELSARIAGIEVQLAELESARTAAEKTLRDAEILLRVDPAGDGREQAVTHAHNTIDELGAQQRTLHEAARSLHQQPQAAEVDWQAPTSLAHLSAVLQEAAGCCLPRVVNDTLRTVTQGSLRLSPVADNDRLLRMTATVLWPSQDGTELTMNISELVRRSVRKNAAAKADLGRSVASFILRDGHSIDEAVTLLSAQHVRTNIVKVATAWLAAHGKATTRMRKVLLDCPIAETKRVAWSLLTGDDLPEGASQEFAALIQATYFNSTHANHGGFTHWSGDVGAARTMLNIFAAALGRGEDISGGVDAADIADMAGVSVGEVLALASRNPRIVPGMRLRALFDRGAHDPRVVVPKKCPTCDSWLLHVVFCPETGDGLVCTTCCAIPGGTALPRPYLALWDGGQAGTHLGQHGQYSCGATVPGHRRLLRIKEAAAVTGVPADTLRSWTKRGLLRTLRKGKGQPYLYDPDDIAALAEELTATGDSENPHIAIRIPLPEYIPGGPAGIPDGFLTVNQAANHLGVNIQALHKLATSTGPFDPPLPYRRTQVGAHLQAIIMAKADLDALDPDWVAAHNQTTLSLKGAASHAGCSIWQINWASQTGQLPFLSTSGGKRRYRPTDVDTWRAGPGRLHTWLGAKAAAQAAGVSITSLSAATSAGDLTPEKTIGGLTKYDPEAIKAWAAARRQPATSDLPEHETGT